MTRPFSAASAICTATSRPARLPCPCSWAGRQMCASCARLDGRSTASSRPSAIRRPGATAAATAPMNASRSTASAGPCNSYMNWSRDCVSDELPSSRLQRVVAASRNLLAFLSPAFGLHALAILDVAITAVSGETRSANTRSPPAIGRKAAAIRKRAHPELGETIPGSRAPSRPRGCPCLACSWCS